MKKNDERVNSMITTPVNNESFAENNDCKDEKIAALPNIADYSIPGGILIRKCLGYKIMTSLPTTKKTLENGSKNSPDTVCTPFKVILGNYLDAINRGANVLIIPAVGCRLGFYDVLQKQILADMGKKIEMVNVFEYANYSPNPRKMYQALIDYNPDLTWEQFDEAFRLTARIVMDIDELAGSIRKNRAFEINKGEFDKHYKSYLKQAEQLETIEAAVALGLKYKDIFDAVELNRPKRPLRIGLVGDLYSVIEPHGNCYIEKWLSGNGVEIVSPITLTYLATNLFDTDTQIKKSGGYVDYYIGGNAGNTIALSYEMMQGGDVDGIIHVKAATCSPEITAMSVLQNMSRDFNVPVIYFTFDTETSDAGVHTRLEAFVDMLYMKRNKQEAL